MSERTLRIIRIVVVVLNVMVAVVSFRRGDTSAMVIAIAVAALFLIQLARSSSDVAQTGSWATGSMSEGCGMVGRPSTAGLPWHLPA